MLTPVNKYFLKLDVDICDLTFVGIYVLFAQHI